MKNWKNSSNSGSQQAGKDLAEYTTSYKDTFTQLDVWLSLFLFMIYVGAEMSLGAWTYTLLTQARGIDPKTAGFWAGSFYGLFATGRILAGLYARRLGNDRIILFSTMGAILGSVMLLVKSIPVVSLIGVVVAGFSIAPIFAALMSGTSSRVKPRFLSNTVGMQMASSGIGGSLLSSLLGILARRISLEVIPFFFIALFVIFLIIYRVTMRRSENLKPIEISAEAT